MGREVGDQGRHQSPLEGNARFPVSFKRTETPHWALLLALKQNVIMLAAVSSLTTFPNNSLRAFSNLKRA